MDLKELDIELNVKMKEAFKKILKERNVEIIFESPIDDSPIIESIVVRNNNHFFFIRIENEIKIVEGLNEKYFPLLSDKMKNILLNSSPKDKIKKLRRKFWWSFIFRYKRGKLITQIKHETKVFIMSYNAVIINLTEIEYKKLAYYSKYVYKLQQLYSLNRELGISQNFNIVFDDDIIGKQMHDNLYESFKSLIEPFNKKNKRDEDEDEDENIE